MSRAFLAVIWTLWAAAAFAQLDENSGSVPRVQEKKVTTVDFSDDPEIIDVPSIPESEYKDLPAASTLGKLVYDDGRELQITPDDVFQMALMIHAEVWGHPTGSDGRWMLWAIAQRLYWRGGTESFAKLIPRYSQPINPTWTLDGSNCKGKAGAGETEEKGKYNACAKHRVEKIEKNLKLQWKDLSAMSRQYAVLFATARLDNPHPGIIGWLAPVVWGPGGEEGKVEVARFDDNVYYVSDKKRKIGGKTRDTKSWTGSEVVVVAPGGKRSGLKKSS